MWCKRMAASALALAMGLFTLSLWAQNKAVKQDHDISAMHEPLPESRVAQPPGLLRSRGNIVSARDDGDMPAASPTALHSDGNGQPNSNEF